MDTRLQRASRQTPTATRATQAVVVLGLLVRGAVAPMPAAANTYIRQVAYGAAQGAAQAAINPGLSNSDPAISFKDDPKKAAAQAALRIGKGAATGALQSAGVDIEGNAVTVDHVRFRSSNSLTMFYNLAGLAVRDFNLTDSQKAVLMSYLAASVTYLNTSIELNCAWQASVSTAFNVAFPDAYAVYNVLYVPRLDGPMDVIRIDGEFPYVRYFSYQSYDPEEFNPIMSVRDYDVRPTAGVNPFAKANSRPKDRGTYTIHVTQNGDQGLQNELATIRPGSNHTGAFVLLRLYAYDPQSPNKTSIWGAVPPPTVRYKLYSKDRQTSGVWMQLDQCNDENTETAATMVRLLSQGIAMAMRAKDATGSSSSSSGSPCPTYNQKDNFFMYQRTDSRAPFINADANYLLSCGNTENLRGTLVAVVNGMLPQSPTGLWDPINIADGTKYNSRYVSLSSYDLNVPGPVLQSLFDYDIVSFYSKIYGSEANWASKYGRKYKVVMTSDEAAARRCGLLTDNAMVLTSKTVTYPGLILREILSKTHRYGAQAAPVASNPSIYAVKASCDTNRLCGKAAAARAIMGAYYPQVTWYECSSNGRTYTPPVNSTVSV